MPVTMLKFIIIHIAGLVVLTGCSANTAPIDNPGSIAELISLEIGGMEQWVLIRGEDRFSPVLLWLHGGPGAAQMPLAHHLDRELEEEFIVVHWDQRGAGKSNHRGFDEQTMSFDRYLGDTHELVIYLKQRFGQEKIFLLGHSWGTQLGIELASKHPEDFFAYISVNQVVDNHRAYEIGYEWLQEQIQKNQKQDEVRHLEELGSPPYTEHSKHVAFAQMVGKYGGNFDISMSRLARIAMRAPEYSIADYYRWLNGANRGSGPMWDEVYTQQINYTEKIHELHIPVFFIAGLHDYNTPHQLVKEYFEKIEAPVKELITFENSAHTPFLGEPEKFSREIIRIKYKLKNIREYNHEL
jgi:pimeloyl-ACP methyl ester carboxylesterase